MELRIQGSQKLLASLDSQFQVVYTRGLSR